jgi:hypothetical protein
VKNLVESVKTIISPKALVESSGQESKIYDALLSFDFDEWYEKDFKDHVVGEEKAPSKEQILKDIKSIFKV